MRVALVRREPHFSFSMDVYANGIVKGLKKVRPDWKIIELTPKIAPSSTKSLVGGLKKYYQRYWDHPQTIRKCEVDLFHVIDHSDGHLIYWLKKHHRPSVVTCHDLINLVRPDTFRGKARFTTISMAAWKWAISNLRMADRVIAVSDHTAKDLTHYLNIERSQITVIPNAVDTSFKPLPPEVVLSWRKQQLSNDRFTLLNVGSNNARKNVSTALKVLSILHQRGLPINFWKVGTDFNDEQKSFIQTQNLATCITYWGEPNDKDLVQLYNAADVLLAPSLYEGFGMTILEAMACGTPVVTSNTSSLPEVAGDAAILVDPLDSVAIATAVQQLYQDQEFCQSLREKGLARVKSFTWERTALQVAELYETVLEKTQSLPN